MSKHIGIVSVSYEGAALCYQTICALAGNRSGDHQHPEITMHCHCLADYLEPTRKGNWPAVAELLLDSAEKVAKAGAEFAICPANTPHEAFEFLLDKTPIPFIHIADVVADAARHRGYKRVAVLGTKFLMEGAVYRDKLASRQIEMLLPDAQSRQRVHNYIYDELTKAILKDTTRQYFVNLIERLAKAGGEAIVLGCTEIPLIVSEHNVTVPLLDSTRLLAAAAVDRAMTAD